MFVVFVWVVRVFGVVKLVDGGIDVFLFSVVFDYFCVSIVKNRGVLDFVWSLLVVCVLLEWYKRRVYVEIDLWGNYKSVSVFCVLFGIERIGIFGLLYGE